MKKPKNTKRPAKVKDVAKLVKKYVTEGKYYYSLHGSERVDQRLKTLGLNDPEVVYVLTKGRRVVRKDEYKEEYKAWNYAFEGMTLDKVKLRVCVAIVKSGALIITVIKL